MIIVIFIIVIMIYIYIYMYIYIKMVDLFPDTTGLSLVRVSRARVSTSALVRVVCRGHGSRPEHACARVWPVSDERAVKHLN